MNKDRDPPFNAFTYCLLFLGIAYIAISCLYLLGYSARYLLVDYLGVKSPKMLLEVVLGLCLMILVWAWEHIYTILLVAQLGVLILILVTLDGVDTVVRKGLLLLHEDITKQRDE